MRATPRTWAWGRLLGTSLVVLAAGCAAKAPQGYGVSQSTASQTQAQFMAAEQSTEVNTATTYLGLIEKMQQAGHWYASLAHTDAFVTQHGASPAVQLLRADALRNTRQYELARQTYTALLGTPQASRAHRGIGLLEASQGRYDAAIKALEQARQLNPVDANTLSDMGYAYMRNGQLEQAHLPVMQAAQLAPDNSRIQLNLALYWLASGEDVLGGQLIQQLRQPRTKAGGALIDAEAVRSLREQVEVVHLAVQARKKVQTQEIPSAIGNVVQVSSYASEVIQPSSKPASHSPHQ